MTADEPDQLGDALHAVGRLLDRDDVRFGGQLLDRRRQDVHGRATGHVVQHDGHGRGLRDGAKMLHQARLGRLVVVRGDDQQRVGTGSRETRAARDRRGGRVGSAAGQHRSAGEACLGAAHQFLGLGLGQGRRLAGRAGDDDAVGALGQVPVEQALPGRVVDVAGRSHRGDQRDDTAGEFQGHAHSKNQAAAHGMTPTQRAQGRFAAMRFPAGRTPGTLKCRDRAPCRKYPDETIAYRVRHRLGSHRNGA